ncbi:lipopolysaccharide biosynthesis protein, partial [Vibrio cyclitrophicus]
MAKSSLVNKRVLLIAPSFFSYSERISAELRRKGAIVQIYDERPSNSFFFKIIFRLGFLKGFFAKDIINNHFNKIYFSFCQDDFDYVLIINPECTPVDFLKNIKDANPGCKTIVYMWDSVVNKPSSKIYIDIVDRFFSFDKRDCSEKVFFQPLFYSNDIYPDDSVESYDFSFVGTLHGDRKKMLTRIISQFSDSR